MKPNSLAIVVCIAAIVAVVLVIRMPNPVVTVKAPPLVNQPIVPVAPSNPPPLVSPATPPLVATTNVAAQPEPPYIPPTVSTPALSNVMDRSLDFQERVRGLASGKVPEVKNQRDLSATVRDRSGGRLIDCSP